MLIIVAYTEQGKLIFPW